MPPLLQAAWLLPLGCILLSGCQGAFFYPEQEHYWDPATEVDLVYEDLWFEAQDGTRLHGWFLPARTEEVHGTVVHFHGNAQNISTHVAAVWWLPRHGFQVLTFDYRGFGRSEGEPSFSGLHQDGRAALRAAMEHEAVDPQRLLVLGQSLGASVAITTTARWEGQSPVGLVAESPFDSYRNIAREKLGSFWLTWPFQYPLSWLLSDGYAPRKHIGALAPIPILLIAGSEDQTVPLAHSKRLYRAAGEPRSLWIIEGAEHNAPLADSQVRQRILETFHGWLDGDSEAAADPPQDPWQRDPPAP
ncbi:MAG: alpha/beta hydrolase [Halorhodospira sp.]